jgi:hypothetical protein
MSVWVRGRERVAVWIFLPVEQWNHQESS